jgi:hypothetical protein
MMQAPACLREQGEKKVYFLLVSFSSPRKRGKPYSHLFALFGANSIELNGRFLSICRPFCLFRHFPGLELAKFEIILRLFLI